MVQRRLLSGEFGTHKRCEPFFQAEGFEPFYVVGGIRGHLEEAFAAERVTPGYEPLELVSWSSSTDLLTHQNPDLTWILVSTKTAKS